MSFIKNIKKLFVVITALGSLIACSTGGAPIKNSPSSNSIGVASGNSIAKTPGSSIGEPAGMSERNTENLETIAILGTNDIHGALVPMQLKTREKQGVEPTTYQTGGLAYLSGAIKILRSELGSRLIWLDAGDEFQGTIESNSEQGAPMVQFFNTAGVLAAAVGNHEFDYSPIPPETDLMAPLKARMREAHYPYLAANIMDKATGKPANLPNKQPHILIDAGKIKVGIIGLSTLDTPSTTRASHVETLSFADLKETTMREVQLLRSEGAQVIVVDAHVGLMCNQGRSTPGFAIRKPTTPQGECNPKDELVKFLHSLPAGTVDAVVSGHSHQLVHNWISGVPVIQGGSSGRYINLIYLTYDHSTNKLLTDRTKIEGPIPICPAVFKNQNDCNGDRPAPENGRGPLVQEEIHGQKLVADEQIEHEIIEPIVKKTGTIKKEIIGEAARPIPHERYKESQLGNLVADAVRASAHADVALVNSGGIRAPFESGPITYGEVFQTLPFDNAVAVMKVTGKELKLILRVAESGSRGFPPVSGARLRIIDPSQDAPASDLDENGKIDAWEINRLIEAKLDDGSAIQDQKTYTFATIDFLLTGGDDFGWPLSQISKDRINLDTGIILRDAVIKYIRSKGRPINTEAEPLFKASAPRLVFEKVSAKKSKKHSKKRHSHAS